jgi:hypothetical protein
MLNTISVTVNGEAKEVLMSYGLLNQLVRTVGDLEQLGSMSIDPDVRDAILKQVLSERTRGGKITKEADLDDIEISVEDVEALLAWVGEHVLNFFLKALETAKALTDKQTDRIAALMPS